MESREDGPQFDESRYAEIVGKRAERYLPRFRRFARGEWISWNWAAFFGTLAWLRYRRLYLWSWLYFFVSTPMLIIWSLALMSGDPCRAALDPGVPYIRYALEALIAASWIVPPFVADRLYFHQVRRLALADKHPSLGGAGTIAVTLAGQGLILFLAMTVIAGLSGDYMLRARMSEALLTASSARNELQAYFEKNHQLPQRLEDATGPIPGNALIRRLEMIERGTIRLTFAGGAVPYLAGHTISLVPTWKENEIALWTCRSVDLPNACLPASCRRQP